MAKTQEDIKRIGEIIDRLEELGVPAKVCRDLRIWRNKEARKLLKKESHTVH